MMLRLQYLEVKSKYYQKPQFFGVFILIIFNLCDFFDIFNNLQKRNIKWQFKALHKHHITDSICFTWNNNSLSHSKNKRFPQGLHPLKWQSVWVGFKCFTWNTRLFPIHQKNKGFALELAKFFWITECVRGVQMFHVKHALFFTHLCFTWNTNNFPLIRKNLMIVMPALEMMSIDCHCEALVPWQSENGN
jgi:hypothetical protein